MNNTTPALNATNLNKLQDNVEDAIQEVQDVVDDLDTNKLDKSSVKDTYNTSATDTYCCDYINGLETYSTDETRVGTWTNNKPIYRKIIEINSLPNNTETAYQTGITNGNIVKYEGYISLSSGDLALHKMPYLSPYSSSGNVYYWAEKNASSVTIKTGTDRTASTAYLILEYTKTTDV